MTPLPHPINFVVLLSIRELFNFGSNQNQKMKKKTLTNHPVSCIIFNHAFKILCNSILFA